MDCSIAGFPVLPEFVQTHVHWVSKAIQPSHPLSPPSLPVLNLSQHQGFFQWVGSSHQVAEVGELQLQHQSFWWIFRVDRWEVGCFLFLFLLGRVNSSFESESKVAPSCPTLWDPMDCRPGSSMHGILQGRILEWAAISFSRASSWSRDWTWVSCTAGRRFTIWATRESHKLNTNPPMGSAESLFPVYHQ